MIALICAQVVYLLGGAFYELAHNDLIWLIWGLTISLGRLQSADKALPIGRRASMGAAT